MPILRARALFSATNSSLRCRQRLRRLQRLPPPHPASLAAFPIASLPPAAGGAARRGFRSGPASRNQGEGPSGTLPPTDPDGGSLSGLKERGPDEEDGGVGTDRAQGSAKDTPALGQNGEEDARKKPAEPAATSDGATTATIASLGAGNDTSQAQPLSSRHTSSAGHAAPPSPFVLASAYTTAAALAAAGHRRRGSRTRPGRHAKASAGELPPFKLPGWLIRGGDSIVLAEPGLSPTELAEKIALSKDAWWDALKLAKLELQWVTEDGSNQPAVQEGIASGSVTLPTKADALQTISLCYMLALAWKNEFDSGPDEGEQEGVGPPADEDRRRELLEGWTDGCSDLIQTYPNLLRTARDWATACGQNSQLRKDRVEALRPVLCEEAKKWISDLPAALADVRQGPLGIIARMDPTDRGHDALDAECAAYTELIASVRAGLVNPFPGISVPEAPGLQQGAVVKRPMTVLTVLNYHGRQVAREVMSSIATDLGADIVHLDACSLARIVGGYLEQSAYWNRGPVSMLGYAVAAYNGRLLPRPNNSPDKPDKQDEGGEQQQQDAQRKRTVVHAAGTVKDDQWDNLKTYHALATLLRAPAIKRKDLQELEAEEGAPTDEAVPSAEASPEQKQEPGTEHPGLIIHLQDYAELEIVDETARLSSKLREVVDRAWLDGRKIVLVGSTSGNITSEEHQHRAWRELVADLEFEEDCHQCVPYRASARRPELARLENAAENMTNVFWQLWGMTGTFQDSQGDGPLFEPNEDDGLKLDEYIETFTQQVYDVQWAQRLATLVAADMASKSDAHCSVDHVLRAYRDMYDRDKKIWSEIYPEAASPPYFSPLTLTTAAGSDLSLFEIEGIYNSTYNNSTDPTRPSSIPADQLEQKYMKSLVKPQDLHTTFADIVLPEETKESLRMLTSLTLRKPDAFTYGVLKSERLSGCLLYGPPGTGKTMLGKAIAKESGCQFLEVHPAMINDMWVGNSEKRVEALFRLARKVSDRGPLVLFLDEGDALLRDRDLARQPAAGARREVITEFLRGWDGLMDNRAFVIVSTNRPGDLDEAVVRRLSRRVLIDLPLREERAAIVRHLLRGEHLALDVDVDALAARTELFSGSDLKNLCVAAATEAVRLEMLAEDEEKERESEMEKERRAHQDEQKKPEQPHFQQQPQLWTQAQPSPPPPPPAQQQPPIKLSATPDSPGSPPPDASSSSPENSPLPLPPRPKRRVLTAAHFEKAMHDISASISEDMDSIKALRAFDQKYGDAGRRRNRARVGLGGTASAQRTGTSEARVRQTPARKQGRGAKEGGRE